MHFVNCATDNGKTHSILTLRRDSIHNNPEQSGSYITVDLALLIYVRNL
jgi:hypothetical protein